MPIKIPDNLPARESLLSEAVDVINSSSAERQDIRPLKFLLLNLMPKKIPTEIQFARLIGASPLQIELTLMTTKSYQPKNTNKDYLIQFYKTLDDNVELIGLYEKFINEFEKPLILKTLEFCRGNQIKAAKILGINRNTLRAKIKKLEIPLKYGKK